jgi:two-component sensor histidine kinase
MTAEFPGIGERTMLLNARRVRRDEQETNTILLAIADITEHRRVQRQIAAALQEKEVLLKEIYHRVKNNLQVISSLLSLQADAVEDPNVRNLLEESQRRIQAMSLVHQKLYASDDLASIDVRAYVQHLLEDLNRAYGTQDRIDFHVQIPEHSRMDIDTAIPFGLILTELISNALKYAFPSPQSGRVAVILRPDGEQRWLLEVQDDGVGIPPHIDIANATSLGLTLVNDLVSQLRGNVQLERSHGTRYRIQLASVDLQEPRE